MNWLIAFAAAVALTACQTREPRDGTAIDSIKQAYQEARQDAETRRVAPPPEVAAALMPALNIKLGGIDKTADEHRFDVNVSGLPARDFFMSLVDDTSYNMVVHPQVDGEVSLVLKNVTIPDVMQVMRDVYGYEYERTRSGFHVLPVRLRSRIYQINYLNVKRSGNSEMRVSSGQVTQTSNSDSSNLSTSNSSSAETVPASKVITESDADFWGELKSALEALVGSEGGRSVVVSPQSGVVVVRAMPNELREVESFLRTTQATLQRQVILEAKIIEVELSDGYQSGINWAKLAGVGSGKTVTFGQTGGGTVFGSDDGVAGTAGNSGDLDPANYAAVNALATQAFGGVFSVAVNAGSFTAFIELLETQGNVQVLSSPRVATVNNQKAVIKVGQDEFFVTDVSTTTVTGTATSTTPEITLTPFFSGIALDVTPQIDNRGGVTLHIHPSVSNVVDQTKTFTIDDRAQTLPLAQSRVRESDSIVYAVSGQIVMIGGLMQESTSEDLAAPPGIGDIPFVGSAFRHTRQRARKSELVILLKPVVVDGPAAWGEALAGSARTIDRLDRGFHYGGKTEVFGTEGEVR
ncbi:MAG: pilus (MSHA type) biogenesis protein MshL [Gammaproteobacteria bacterium]|nr:pilus (MSHA type) biogenesis protein MshL [Gammaproteobacteria bacterium]MCP5299910.1 pilus (MSHA type) biogenesis protein MshL [Chromatiaceae bacterium]